MDQPTDPNESISAGSRWLLWAATAFVLAAVVYFLVDAIVG